MAKLISLLSSITHLVVEKKNYFDCDIKNLAINQKKVTKDSLFFCISREEFTEMNITPPLQSYPQAIKKGVIAVLSSDKQKLNLPKNIVWIKVSDEYLAMALIIKEFYNDLFKNTKIIGITGTNGKTTTNKLLDGIFTSLEKQIASVGTLGIMCQEKNIFTGLTTPLLLDLYQYLAEFQNLDYLVVEITSHASHFQRTASLEFDLLIFTNLTSDHLDFHPSWEDYKQSKLIHFQKLAQQKKKAIALINIDDFEGQKLVKLLNKNKVIFYTYSICNKNADFYAKILKITDNSSCYDVFYNGKYFTNIDFPLAGFFNVYNSLASFCASYLLGFSVTDITYHLKTASPVVGRFEKIPNIENKNIFVDYAHTSNSLENVLCTIRSYIIQKSSKKLITVFGCGGDRDKTKRPIMGKIAALWSDFIILTNDNPRTESSQEILEQILIGIPNNKKKNVVIIPDRRKAIYTALEKAEKEDVVLIAGKGHEKYQIIGKQKKYFLDKKVILDFFQQQTTTKKINND